MEKLLNILPEKVRNVFLKIPKEDFIKLTEIRLRVSYPIFLYFGRDEYAISDNGLSKRDGFVFSEEDAETMWRKLCDGSPYSMVKNQRDGYITVEGNRIGFTGEYNCVDGKIKHIEKITSFCVRIMHEKKGCANKIYKYLYENNNLLNILIISPPGCGKTTLLRDVIRLVSFDGYNVALIDERDEIACLNSGKPTLDIGKRCDVLSGIDKEIAIENSVRSLKPDVIVLDEIANNEYEIIKKATTRGVKIIATLHGEKFSDIKAYLDVFDKFVFLSDKMGVGTVEGIFDCEGKNCC